MWGDDSNVFAVRESSTTSERGRRLVARHVEPCAVLPVVEGCCYGMRMLPWRLATPPPCLCGLWPLTSHQRLPLLICVQSRSTARRPCPSALAFLLLLLLPACLTGGRLLVCCPTPTVKIHRNFKEALTIRTGFAAEAIHGGQLLSVRAQDFIVFYDWATGKVSGWVGLGVGRQALVGAGRCAVCAGYRVATVCRRQSESVR